MTRSLPSRPHLDADRKRAKALKKAHAQGDPEALATIRAHHPRFGDARPDAIAAAPFRLADAQLVVAREYGIESWPRLAALVAFLRTDLAERARLFVETAVGERPERTADLLARAPELAGADLPSACAAADEDAALRILDRDPAAATRPDGPLGAQPLWTLCWSNAHPGVPKVDAARVQIAMRLLAAGADPSQTAERVSSWGRHAFTALYGTVENARPGLTKVLLEAGADPNDGECLYHATEHGDSRCLSLLLAHGAEIDGSNALFRALDLPSAAPVERLLEAGADPSASAAHQQGWNALHHAALRNCAPEIFDRLLDRGAPIDAPAPDGHSAFQIAWRAGHRAGAERLRERGADPALATADRFVGACAMADAATARAMLASGEIAMADLSADDLGALARAAEWGRLPAVRLMLDLGFPIESEGGDWRGTPLNHAAHASCPEIVALLLERGADPEIRNEFEGSALGALAWSSTHWVLGNPTYAPGRSEARRQEQLVACAELLLAAGVEITANQLANASPAVAEVLRRFGAAEA